jgi:hypothetical protein
MTMAVSASPTAAHRPLEDRTGQSIQAAIGLVRRWRWVQRNTTKVAPIEATEASVNCASQGSSGGTSRPNTARFAGFEIGSKKLAALATNAQISRYSNGPVPAARAAA